MISTVALRAITSESVVVIYGGREFIASSAMANAFFARAQRLVESGATELVPLLHQGGVELLLISREIPFTLVEPSTTLKRSA